MDEARVLAGPAEAGGDGEGALDDGTSVNVGAGFEVAERRVQLGLKCVEALLEHLVIIARLTAGLHQYVGEGVAGDPAGSLPCWVG